MCNLMWTIENLKKVYSLLEDEESQFTWLKRLNYLITNDTGYIDQIIARYLPEFQSFYEDVFNRMSAALPKNKRFVLFGAGKNGRDFLNYFKEDERLFGFCSSNPRRQQEGVLGFPCISPEQLFRERKMCVVISALDAKDEILHILKEADYPSELIFTIDDDLTQCNDQYFGPDFIHFSDSEVFVDAGCFDFSSSLSFYEHSSNLKKVYAFEPDPNNFKLCQQKANSQSKIGSVCLFEAGTWSESKKLFFNSTATNPAGSRIDDQGSTSIDVCAIDNVVDPNCPVTFIKMDVEGSELESLKGARETILRDKPKLAICIYHKPEDMTEIPLYIKSLVPEYKFYVRHHSNYVCETVLYAVLP